MAFDTVDAMRLRGKLPAYVLCLLTAGPGLLAAQQAAPADAALTLEQILQRAEANEPAFAAAAAERQATSLEAKDARASLLPSASFHNQFLFTQSNHTHTTPGTGSGQYVQQGDVSQSLPVFIANNSVHEYYSQGVVNETLGLAQISAVRVADARAMLAAAEAEIARRGLVATVSNLYFGVTAGEDRVSIAARALDEANRFVDVTQKREAAREAAHADVVKAQLQQQQRQRELTDAKLNAQKTRLELGVLLFLDPSVTYSLAPAQAPPLLPDRAGIESAARANNPEIRSALATLAAGQAQTSLERAALLPDLGLNVTYGIDAPQFARTGPEGALNLGYSASATLDLPLWDWLTTERKVKEAHIRAEAAKVALSAAQRRLIADLGEFYAEAETARKQLASLDESVITARESLRLTNLRYVDGEGTVLDVVDAQNTLTGSELAQTDGVLRYRLALMQLQTLTGRF